MHKNPKSLALVLSALPLLYWLLAAPPALATSPRAPQPEHLGARPHPGNVRGHAGDQMTNPDGPRRAAVAAAGPVAAPFLTRPYWGPHNVTSVFDHCNPTYTSDGKICEFDGTVALRANGVDPTFSAGYPITPGGTDYLYYDGHNGWDLALSYETLIAAAPGTVAIAGYDANNPGFGLTVTIDHGNGFTTRYGHMSQVAVSPGQIVARGQVLGVSGNSGNSTGPHLHFGVYVTSSWIAIDPWGWTGPGADPWPYQQGDLWLTGNPHDPVPDAPSAASASLVNGAVQVSWPAPFDGGSPITSYVVTASPGGATQTVPGGQLTASFPSLPPGAQYSFTVVARTAIGSSPPSSPSNAVNPGVAPGAPAGVRAFGSGGRLAVAWQAPAVPGSAPISRYDVTLSPGGARVSAAAGAGPAPTLTSIGGLDPGVAYTATVTAVNPFGSGPASAASAPARPSGAPAGSVPADTDQLTATDADGRAEFIIVGGDRQMWHGFETAPGSGSWACCAPLGGYWPGEPSLVRAAGGRLEVYLVGSDRQLWVGWQARPGDPTSWVCCAPFGGYWPGDPAVASDGSGRAHVLFVGGDGQLWHGFEGTPGDPTTFRCCAPEGGVWPGQLAAVGRPDGRVEAFLVGSDGQLWHTVQGSPSDPGIGCCAPLGGYWPQAQPRPAINSDGRVEVFLTGPDAQLWHLWQNAAGTTSDWTCCIAVGGSWPGAPAIGTAGSGALEVFLRGGDSQLWIAEQTAAGNSASLTWSGAVAGPYRADPLVATDSSGVPTALLIDATARLARLPVPWGAHLASLGAPATIGGWWPSP